LARRRGRGEVYIATTPEELKKMKVPLIWQPQEGPQMAMFESSAFEILYGGAKGGGKCLPYSASVITPFGVSTMADMEVGSQVSNPDGSVATVIGVYPQPAQTIYKVTFSDGATVRCTGDHLWRVHIVGSTYKAKRRMYLDEDCVEDNPVILGRVWTTDMLRQRLDRIKSGDLHGNVTRWPLIPMTQPVQFTRTMRYDNITIPPYLVGLLLGDGCLSKGMAPKITTIDAHTIDYLKSLEFCSIAQHENDYALNGGIVKRDVERLGLAGHRAHEKFMPDRYKFGDIETRFEILRGLLDTDGTADGRGHVSFTSVSKQLAEDVQFVARSLGGKATLTEAPAGYKKEDGAYVQCRTAYSVYIQTRDNSQLFNLPRKKECCAGKKYNGGLSDLQRRMVSIEEDGFEEAVCIKVDHPNGLFLTDGFVVTHNSDAILMCALRQAKKPNYRGLILKRTYKRLSDIIDRSRDLYPRAYQGAQFDKTDKRWTFPYGGIIDFGHCESEDDKRNYAGQEYQYMAFDQIEEFTQSMYEFIAANCRTSKPNLRCEIKCTANPGGVGMAWVHKRWIDNRDPYKIYTQVFTMPDGRKVEYTSQFIPAKVYDNKILLQNDPMYLARLMNLPEDERRAMLDGDWNVFEGMYFREWRPTKDNEPYHVITPFAIPPNWKRFRSLDWGFRDPSAVYWHAVSPDYGRIITYQELYESGLTASQLAQKMNKLTPKDDYISYTVASPDIWAKRGNDSLHGESIAETMQKHDIRLTKADNNRINGWMRMREFMAEAPDGKPYWQVFSTCKNLIRTLPTLIYDDHDKEDVNDAGEDHACFVAGTRIRTPDGSKPIEALRVGDMVATRQGYKPVIDHACTGVKPVMQAWFSNGQTLIGTEDHPVWTPRGYFVPLGSLWRGDEVEDWKQNPLCLTASHTDDTQTRPTLQTDATTKQTEHIAGLVKATCTEKSGKQPMARYPKDIMSTTKMATQLTTPSRTLSVCKGLTISRITQRCRSGLLNAWRNSKRFAHWLLHGMGQKQGVNLVEEMPSTSAWLLYQESINACNVARHLPLSITEPSSAPMPVSQNGAGQTGLTTSRGSVLSAARRSRPTNIATQTPARANAVRLVDSYQVGIAAVYNITVDEAHEYYANDILVSNCESVRYGLMSRPRPNAMIQPEISGIYHPNELRLLGYTEAKIRSLVQRGAIQLIGKLRR
jgi:phage terminase large subunit